MSCADFARSGKFYAGKGSPLPSLLLDFNVTCQLLLFLIMRLCLPVGSVVPLARSHPSLATADSRCHCAKASRAPQSLRQKPVLIRAPNPASVTFQVLLATRRAKIFVWRKQECKFEQEQRRRLQEGPWKEAREGEARMSSVSSQGARLALHPDRLPSCRRGKGSLRLRMTLVVLAAVLKGI